MLESDIQRRFIKEAKAQGFFIRKVVCVGDRGFPDLILIRDGRVWLVEIKATKGRLSPSQVKTAEAIQAQNSGVLVAYGLNDAMQLLDNLRTTP